MARTQVGRDPWQREGNRTCARAVKPQRGVVLVRRSLAAVMVAAVALTLVACGPAAVPPVHPVGAAAVAPARPPVAGSTTRVQASGANVGVAFSGVDFVNARTGWVIGQRCPAGGAACQAFVLGTRDDGGTWNDTNLGSLLPQQVDFIDARTGWAVEASPCANVVPCSSVLIATADGGASWQRRYSGSETLSSVQFLDAEHGWALGAEQVGCGADLCGADLLRTDDGGRNWETASVVPLTGVLGFDFLTPSRGWITGLACGGTKSRSCQVGIESTQDGGGSWQQELSLAPAVYEGNSGGGQISFATAADGWALLPVANGCTMGGCWGPLYRTRDGGETWVPIQPGASGGWNLTAPLEAPPGWPGSLRFVTATVGWIPVGAGAGPGVGGVARTEDAGATWTRFGAGRWDIAAVAPTSAAEAWAVGWPHAQGDRRSGGLLLHTTDGGQTWAQVLPAPAPAAEAGSKG